MQAENCWRSVGRRWPSQNASPSGAVYGLSHAFGPLPSVSQPLGRSRLQRPWSPGRLNCHGWVASGPLQRLVTGWRTRRRTRLQPQVRKDLLDHRLLKDRGDDLQLTAAVRARFIFGAIQRSNWHPDQPTRNQPLSSTRKWPTAGTGERQVLGIPSFTSPRRRVDLCQRRCALEGFGHFCSC